MSDEKLKRTVFVAEGEELDACADTERAPASVPTSTPRLGAALSVLMWQAEEPDAK